MCGKIIKREVIMSLSKLIISKIKFAQLNRVESTRMCPLILLHFLRTLFSTDTLARKPYQLDSSNIEENLENIY